MKALISKLTFIVICFFVFIYSSQAQDCTAIQDFESYTIDSPLQPSAQFGGYYTVSGSPVFWEENCTPGGSVGLLMKANVDGSGGDVVGYTESFGINPQPTFLSGQTYAITGKKLMSTSTIGEFSSMSMTVSYSGGPTIISKDLMLSPGECVPWTYYEFVSPGDYDGLEIAFAGSSPTGDNNLFIVIDDWCVQQVVSTCVGNFDYEDLGCGQYQLINLSPDNVTSWKISSNDAKSTLSSSDPSIEITMKNGIYYVKPTKMTKRKLSLS
ncbi:MAG: hypothetical protein V3V14_13055 [Saprospiraceae bacterium]